LSHPQVRYNDAVETKPAANVPTTTVSPWPARDNWGLLPVVAVIGGMWAFTASPGSGDLTTLVAALVTVLGGWTPLWHTSTTTLWSAPLASWRAWEREEPLPHWPYLQPDTPGAAIHGALRRARAWWREVGRDVLADPLRATALAWIVSVLAGLILGRTALLLTLVLTAWTEMAVLWHEGRGHVGTGWAAGALVGLPWLLGAALVATDIVLPVLSALALFTMMGFYAIPSPVAMVGPIIAALLLVWQGHFIAAGVLLVLALPPLMLLLYHPPKEDYRRAVIPWLATMIALMAWAL
jgi:hypothetical protein